jgi:hypothetical protein
MRLTLISRVLEVEEFEKELHGLKGSLVPISAIVAEAIAGIEAFGQTRSRAKLPELEGRLRLQMRRTCGCWLFIVWWSKPRIPAGGMMPAGTGWMDIGKIRRRLWPFGPSSFLRVIWGRWGVWFWRGMGVLLGLDGIGFHRWENQIVGAMFLG